VPDLCICVLLHFLRGYVDLQVTRYYQVLLLVIQALQSVWPALPVALKAVVAARMLSGFTLLSQVLRSLYALEQAGLRLKTSRALLAGPHPAMTHTALPAGQKLPAAVPGRL